jgi:hypothetical protein
MLRWAVFDGATTGHQFTEDFFVEGFTAVCFIISAFSAFTGNQNQLLFNSVTYLPLFWAGLVVTTIRDSTGDGYENELTVGTDYRR